MQRKIFEEIMWKFEIYIFFSPHKSYIACHLSGKKISLFLVKIDYAPPQKGFIELCEHLWYFVFGIPDPKGQVNVCHHLVSIVIVRCELLVFKKIFTSEITSQISAKIGLNHFQNCIWISYQSSKMAFVTINRTYGV